MLVDSASPLLMRQRVEKLGRYFKREFRTDVLPMRASESPGNKGFVPYEAHLFFEEARDLLEEGEAFPSRVVGAACFRCDTCTDGKEVWELSWVWLHPFSRRCGHLSRAWPEFLAKYGPFVTSEVLSRDMAAFLKDRKPTDKLIFAVP